ncbi:LPXTG cell wall anchor domain-containing protein [Limosilactobacillus fermentum]|uniref:LPXTG cell wall anchor domain-containing protein n=3 Tax=Limosilactobacillus fermentum TaxID=1613 RepID=UPI002E8E14DE|nr:LPXTG cell wall anchor domain-containing protein [Limosilactobacillus fermentum]
MMAKRNEATKTQAVDAIQARIADLKALLNSYQNAGTNLAAAQAAVTSANQAVADASAKLAALKQQLGVDQTAVAAAQVAYDAAVANQAAAQAAQQTRLAQERALQEVENQAQGLKQTSSAVTLSKASNKQAPVKTTEQQLPQTGNDEGLLASALGMVLMALATAFGIQKRKED